MVSDDAKAALESDDIKLDTPVTTVIRQRPRPDAVDRYENWLKEIIPVAQQFSGHRAVNVIRPHGTSGDYTIVLHFDTIANLRKWLNSDVRRRLIDQIRPSLSTEEKIDIKTGFEFWFTPPPGGKPARPYKQFLVTLSAIFPLTILIPWLLQPAFAALPLLALPGVRQCRCSYRCDHGLRRNAALYAPHLRMALQLMDAAYEELWAAVHESVSRTSQPYRP